MLVCTGIAFAAAACADGPIVRTVTIQAFVNDAYENRDPVGPPIHGRLAHTWEYVLPDSVSQFGLEVPRAIDALGPPACEVIVGDDIDEAIHRFSLDGEYLGSVYYPHSRRSSSVGAVAADARWIWVSFLASGEIAVINRTTGSAARFPIPPLSDSTVPYSRLSRGPEGTVLEHWMGILNDTWSADWDSSLPLIRWFARDGTLLGRAGSVHPARGQVLTGMLNRGMLDYAKDTVWFAETAAARVIAVPIKRMAHEWRGTTVHLPVPFQMSPPAEYRDRETGRTFARVEYHLTGFAVAPSATSLALGYVLSWPDPDAPGLYQPRTVLALYDRRNATLRAYDLGGRIWEVKMPTDDALVVLLTDSRLGRRVVRGYRVRQPTPGGGHTCANDPA